jgi:hypothetical protein
MKVGVGGRPFSRKLRRGVRTSATLGCRRDQCTHVSESIAELLAFEGGESTTVTVAIARQHASVSHQDGRQGSGKSLPSLCSLHII